MEGKKKIRKLCLGSGPKNKTQSQFSDLNSESKDLTVGCPWLFSLTSTGWLIVYFIP